MPTQTTLRILWYKYKDFSFPLGVSIICLCLILFVLIPQGVALLNQEQNVQQARLTIAQLQQNLTTIEGYDTSQTQVQLQEANAALPTTKDFSGIIATLQTATEKSNVTLSDYSFEVGDLVDANQTGKVGTFRVSISLLGTAQQVALFLHDITHQLPLVDINDVHGNVGNAALTLLFYYQPEPKLTVQTISNFSPITSQEQSTINTINAYNTPQ